jgi:hypothetical protein
LFSTLAKFPLALRKIGKISREKSWNQRAASWRISCAIAAIDFSETIEGWVQ